jgi:phytoene synthase
LDDGGAFLVYPLATMTGAQSDLTLVEAMDKVESLVRRSKTTFFWAMRLLPEAKRNAMYAVYAFCREVDDIADEPGIEAEKRARLSEWRQELENVFAGQGRFPVSLALAGAATGFGLEKKDCLAIVDGMEMDASDAVRIADGEEFNLYCDRVACAVGRLSVRVFGIDGEDGNRLARSLGQALQVTNILRDLHEDAMLNRLYLPADRLRAHGITELEPMAVLDHPALPKVCDELAELANRRFQETATILSLCDRREVRPVLMMMVAYRLIFQRLQRRGWKRNAQPMKLSLIDKIWIVLRYGIV